MANVILPNAKTVSVKVVIKNGVTIISPLRVSQKDELIDVCKRVGIKVEIQKKDNYSTLIGIMFTGKQSNHIWHWMEFYESSISLYESLSFNHSYNMNTGVSKKSFNQSWNVRERLMKLTGFNSWYSRSEKI